MGQRAIQDLQSREVEVNRKSLIDTLKKNKESHIKTYNESLTGYKKAATAKLKEDGLAATTQLEKRLKQVEADIEEFDPEKPHEFSDHFILIQQVVMTLPVPQSYAAEYEAAIDIAKWDVNDTMKLTFAEFQCFVRDEWDWKSEFLAISKSYTQAQ